MKRLVFDIETAGEKFARLDKEQKQYLTRFAHDEKELLTAKQSTSFYPVTGIVVAIGMFSPDYPGSGKVYYINPDSQEQIKDEKQQVILEPFANEKDLLERFWQAVANFDQVITFNGRGFDVPFLMIRSAINQVKITADLMGYRYDKAKSRHVDLADQLSFYGVTKKVSLDMFCKAFGIKSPKSGGVTGLQVPALFYKKKYVEIAKYCYGDVVATHELYTYWRNYIALEK